MIPKIALATDFSEEGHDAFLTALALGVAYRSRLDILHVSPPGQEAEWQNFPRVRGTLQAWGLLPRDARQEDVANILGLEIRKVEIHNDGAVAGISEFILGHEPDLLIAASHARIGVNKWLAGSVAMETLRKTSMPTLLLGPGATPFLDIQSGTLRLHNILFPVATSPSPLAADALLRSLLGDIPARVHHLHVGENAREAGQLRGHFPRLTEAHGDVVSSILVAAERVQADAIVMPTAGHRGFMDALRGSVTQRILRDASCPILAIPS